MLHTPSKRQIPLSFLCRRSCWYKPVMFHMYIVGVLVCVNGFAHKNLHNSSQSPVLQWQCLDSMAVERSPEVMFAGGGASSLNKQNA